VYNSGNAITTGLAPSAFTPATTTGISGALSFIPLKSAGVRTGCLTVWNWRGVCTKWPSTRMPVCL
jgi:hypothetical protein